MVVISTSAGWNFNMGIESSFNSGTGTYIGQPGVGAKITTFEVKNNLQGVYQLNTRLPTVFFSKGIEIDIGVDFIFANDNVQWMQYILTGGSVVGGSVASGFIVVQTPEGNVWSVSGIVYDSVKFSVSAGGELTVSLSGKGTKFSSVAETITAPTIPSQIVTWDKCNLNIGGGQPIQNMNVTINTNAELFRTLNNLYYVAYLPKEFSGEFSAEIMHDSGIIETLQLSSNPAGTQSATVTLGSHTLTLGVAPNSGGIKVEPVNPVIDSLSFVLSNATFV
jgi:hypothetical protein